MRLKHIRLAAVALTIFASLASHAQVTHVAVVGFRGVGLDSDASEVLTTKLRGLLSSSDYFHPVSPSMVADAIKQQGLADGQSCEDQCGAQVARATGAEAAVYGILGKIEDTYHVSLNVVRFEDDMEVTSTYSSEVTGTLTDVLKNGLPRTATKMMERMNPRALEKLAPAPARAPARTAATGEGWIKVDATPDDAEIFVDGHLEGKGDIRIQLPAGPHRVTAKSGDDVATEVVEVYPEGVSFVSLKAKLSVRFTLSADWAFMLGTYREVGPSHNVGLRFHSNYIGLNYYWGVIDLRYPAGGGDWYYGSDEIFGGGLVFMREFNLTKFAILSIGGTQGFWMEYGHERYRTQWGDWDYNYVHRTYLGGPKAKIQIGYRPLYFTADFVWLIGLEETKPCISIATAFLF